MHRYVVQTPADISLVNATLKTLVQVVTGATRRLKITEIGCSFASVTSTDPPVLLQLRLQTTAGTMSANTPLIQDQQDPAAIFTAQDTATVEPTDGGALNAGPWKVTPIGGTFVYQFPAGQEPIMKVSTRVGLTATSGAAESGVRAYLVLQE